MTAPLPIRQITSLSSQMTPQCWALSLTAMSLLPGRKFWCEDHSLSLNIQKTKEMMVDFRKADLNNHPPLYIRGEAVERASSIKFLGVTLTEELTWSNNTASVVGKAHQRLNYLRKMRRVNLPQRLLINFYHCVVESVLTYCVSAWYFHCTKAEKEALQSVIKNHWGRAARYKHHLHLPLLTALTPYPQRPVTSCPPPVPTSPIRERAQIH